MATTLLSPLATATGKTTLGAPASPRSATKTAQGVSSIDFLWREARVLFLSKLPTRQQDKEALRDDTASLDDTIRSLKTARERASQAYGNKFKGTPVEFKLSRALQRLDLMLRIGDQAMQFAPETASYAWAAFRMIAAGVLQNFETCQFIADAVDEMTDLVFTCQVYARRQMKRFPVFTVESQMLADKILEKIPEVLALVLQFAYETRKLLLDKGKIGRTISVMLGASQELKETVSDAQAKRDDLHRVADIAFHEAAIEVLEAAHADTEAIRDYLQISSEELLRVVRSIEIRTKDEVAPAVKALQSEQAREKERHELDNDWREQLRWLRSGGPAELGQTQEMLRDNLTRRHPGTCKWIFDDEKFTRWLEATKLGPADDDDPPKRLLWLVGEAGFGKSVLMSSIVEWLESREEAPSLVSKVPQRPVVVPLFCKTGSDALQKGNRVMLHLLLQLLHQAGSEELLSPFVAKSATAAAPGARTAVGPDVSGVGSRKEDKEEKMLLERKRACVDLVKAARSDSKDKNVISFQEFQTKSGMVPLLCDMARKFGGSVGTESSSRPVYVVVDALDECDDRNDGFLEALIQIATSTDSNVHIVVSSRPEPDIRTALNVYDPPSIDITKASTAADVEAYIKASLTKVKRFPAAQRKAAMAKIAMKADGMFRYANLALQSLVEPAAFKIPFKQLMNNLPDGMTGLYEQQLRGLDKDHRELLLVALRWVVCGEGKISFAPVADELEHTYLVDDEDEDEDGDLERGGEGDDETDDEESEASGEETSRTETTSDTEKDEDDLRDHQRDSMRPLKAAGRDFLKFDEQNNVTLQHASVRDFILRQSRIPIKHGELLCARCHERFGTYSTVGAGPKRGHLDMALHCLRTLNSRAFQHEFLPESILKEHRIAQAKGESREGGEENESREDDESDKEDDKEGDDEQDQRTEQQNDGIENIDHAASVKTNEQPGMAANLPPPTIAMEAIADVEEHSVAVAGDVASAYAPTDAGSEWTDGSFIRDGDAFDPQLRYELTHWHYHVRAAEQLWDIDERDQDEWAVLYDEIDKFLTNEDVFHTWQRLVLRWRAFKVFDRPVHIAARYGIMHYLRRYLEEENGDADSRNENDSTPLQLACLGAGDFLGVELLVEYGADVNARALPIVGGQTCLHNLVSSKAPPHLIRYLIAHGADPMLRSLDDDQTTILHIAVLARNFEHVQAILEYRPPAGSNMVEIDVNVPDNLGETPLHKLFSWPNMPENILRLLLKHGADVNTQDKDSQAPLYEATLSGDVMAARALLEVGADVNDVENVFGRTALHQAIESQNAEMVDVLLAAGADPLMRDKQLRNAIGIAAYRSNASILSAVLRVVEARAQSGTLTAAVVEDSETAAVSATDLFATAATEDAANAAGVGLLGPDINGHTPLHIGASRGRAEIVLALLKTAKTLSTVNTAALTTAVNRAGNTPLHSASSRGYANVVALLLQHGALPDARNGSGALALDLAVRFWRTQGILDSDGGDGVGEGRHNSRHTVELLLSHGATVSDAALRRALLDVAIESGSVEICQRLLEQDQNVHEFGNRKDRHGWSPLMLASQTRQTEIIHLLEPYDCEGLLEKTKQKESVITGLSPTRWSAEPTHAYVRLAVSEDGLEAFRTLTGDFDPERGLIRANHPVPFGLSRFYFEITVLRSEWVEGIVGIGLASRYTLLNKMPGWASARGPSFGYHGDDGGIFMYNEDGACAHIVGPVYTQGDTVGCGVDFTKGSVFFTRNGVLLGDVPYKLEGGRFFPVVGIGPEDIRIRANFGTDSERQFRYDPITYGTETTPPDGLRDLDKH